MASTGFSSFTFDSWLKVKRAEKALRRQDNCTSLCVTEKVLCKCEAVCKLGLCCLETFTGTAWRRRCAWCCVCFVARLLSIAQFLVSPACKKNPKPSHCKHFALHWLSLESLWVERSKVASTEPSVVLPPFSSRD